MTMTLRTQIIEIIINKSVREEFNGTIIERSALASSFFLEPMFKKKMTANLFIQKHYLDIANFKNEFMQDDDTDIFSHPTIFLIHLVRRYARMILASLTLNSNVEINDDFRNKLEALREM